MIPLRRTAFSRFPPVHRTDLEGQQRDDLTRSPSSRRVSAICAKRTIVFSDLIGRFGFESERSAEERRGGSLALSSRILGEASCFPASAIEPFEQSSAI
jgi:hypothetical protein